MFGISNEKPERKASREYIYRSREHCSRRQIYLVFAAEEGFSDEEIFQEFISKKTYQINQPLFGAIGLYVPLYKRAEQASTGKMKKIHVSNRSIGGPPPSRLTVQSLLNLYQNRKNPFMCPQGDFTTSCTNSTEQSGQ